jgi:hypothetical protein
MEVYADLAAGQDKRALDLMRLEWGYMLNAPQGTASTYWEGYRTDGSSDYGGSYESLAHGWSSGPTAALTFFVLGIRPDPNGKLVYSLIPHPGDLHHVEGQLSTPRGVIRQSYDADRAAGTFSARYSAPAGALDEVASPHRRRLRLRPSRGRNALASHVPDRSPSGGTALVPRPSVRRDAIEQPHERTGRSRRPVRARDERPDSSKSATTEAGRPLGGLPRVASRIARRPRLDQPDPQERVRRAVLDPSHAAAVEFKGDFRPRLATERFKASDDPSDLFQMSAVDPFVQRGT